MKTGTAENKLFTKKKAILLKRVSEILAEINARVRWLSLFRSLMEISDFLSKLQDHLPMTKRAVGKRCDIMQMIKLIKRS